MPVLISVKAGRCLPSDDDPKKFVPSDVPGTITLSTSPEDEGLIHFGWSPRKGHTVEEEFDLIIFPGDATFTPYTSHPSATKTGRIYVLKFSSSSQRHLFWFQTKVDGEPGQHSAQDRLLGKKINRFLETGGEVDDLITEEEFLGEQGAMDLDDDAGPDAGEASRSGGADGGRAANTRGAPASATAGGASGSGGAMSQSDFVNQLLRNIQIPGSSSSQQTGSLLTLPSLLPTSVTVPLLESKKFRKALLENLPPTMTTDLKSEYDEKELLRKVLHSPQFAQAAVMMTVALREGGLKGVADSLGVKLNLAAHGNEAGVEIFLAGIKQGVEEEKEDDTDMGNT